MKTLQSISNRFYSFTVSYNNNSQKTNYISDDKLMKIIEEGLKKKKACRCMKSKCLKLYCECFANGEFCIDCDCTDCSNIIGNEKEISNLFQTVEKKNPLALKFLKKESEIKKQDVSCNCTKSNCNKKYCECFKIGQSCSDSCRCRTCNNLDMSNYSKLRLINNFAVEKLSVLIEDKQLYVTNTMHSLKQFFNSDEFIEKSISEANSILLGGKRERNYDC
jgi:hypothetical protein